MTAVRTTADHLQALAPAGADIELDAAANRLYVEADGVLWWAPLSDEVCS